MNDSKIIIVNADALTPGVLYTTYAGADIKEELLIPDPPTHVALGVIKENVVGSGSTGLLFKFISPNDSPEIDPTINPLLMTD